MKKRMLVSLLGLALSVCPIHAPLSPEQDSGLTAAHAAAVSPVPDSIVFVRTRKPNEGAFTLLMPKGWQTGTTPRASRSATRRPASPTRSSCPASSRIWDRPGHVAEPADGLCQGGPGHPALHPGDRPSDRGTPPEHQRGNPSWGLPAGDRPGRLHQPYSGETEIRPDGWKHHWQNSAGEVVVSNTGDYDPNHDDGLRLVKDFKQSQVRPR